MSAILTIRPLGSIWETSDPFLFCAYHEDQYPKGNDQLGPDASLAGRNIGQDFTIKDGWRMYHGHTVPGFPAHPHRGFETVTIVQKGLVDHSDSLGAAGRFGNGDVQWMTAGKGVQHSEMFPLLQKEKENPLLMFQIWLNLPREKKMVLPHFKMLWNEDIPKVHIKDLQGKTTEITLIAGNLKEKVSANPAPDSWASNPENEIAIWTIKMEPNAQYEFPKASKGINRSIYFFKGDKINSEGSIIPVQHEIILAADKEFTVNAMLEYHQTQFGGWPWSSYDHVHKKSKGRFALYPDGSLITK